MATKKFSAKNITFKAKRINSYVDKDYVAEMSLAAANDYVSDPNNVVDVRKHNFFVLQDEEIPVQRYMLNELKDPKAIELRIRQGHNGKVSLLTRRSNVKSIMTTKRVRITWMFDKNSQFKSILVINAQPEREDNPQLYYSEFCPNKEVEDESGNKTMPYLTWEQDQIMDWFMDKSKNRGCVLAVSDEEFDKSAPWIRGDKFFYPEEEEKEEEFAEPDVTEFIGHEKEVANFIAYCYCYGEGRPFTYNRCDEVVEDNPGIVTEENLQQLTSDYEDRYSWNDESAIVADIVRNNKEAFLDVLSMIGSVMCCIFQNATEDPHLHGESFEDEDEEECFQEDGPELNAEEGFKKWVEDLDGGCYSETYKSVIERITENLQDSDCIIENWFGWLFE